MIVLILDTPHGPIYWNESHCTSDPREAKAFDSPEEAQAERWQVAGTDFAVAEL